MPERPRGCRAGKEPNELALSDVSNEKAGDHRPHRRHGGGVATRGARAWKSRLVKRLADLGYAVEIKPLTAAA